MLTEYKVQFARKFLSRPGYKMATRQVGITYVNALADLRVAVIFSRLKGPTIIQSMEYYASGAH